MGGGLFPKVLRSANYREGEMQEWHWFAICLGILMLLCAFSM